MIFMMTIMKRRQMGNTLPTASDARAKSEECDERLRYVQFIVNFEKCQHEIKTSIRRGNQHAFCDSLSHDDRQKLISLGYDVYGSEHGPEVEVSWSKK